MYRLQQIILCLLFSIVMTGTLYAQLTEDFENGSVNSFGAVGIAGLDSGNWRFVNASLGTTASDKKTGARSVRLDSRGDKTGEISMLFGKAEGASVLRFDAAAYGSDSGMSVEAAVAYDCSESSPSYTPFGDLIAVGGELSTYQMVLNNDQELCIRLQAAGDGRVNIDNFVLEDYVVAEEDPTLDVFADGAIKANNTARAFEAVKTGDSSRVQIQIRNRGSQTLFVDTAYVIGAAFSSEPAGSLELEFLESEMMEVVFTSGAGGDFEGELVIVSNAFEQERYSLRLKGTAAAPGDVFPIELARKEPEGTSVKVSGRVTVTDQFDGPGSLEDATAGISVYDSDFHAEAEIGDSVIVTGDVSYPPFAGDNPEDFQLQLSGNVSFEILPVARKEVQPAIITLNEMNSGTYESRLVLIENVSMGEEGVFQGETSYDMISDQGKGVMRIDGDASGIVGASIPEGEFNVVGLVDQFAGTYQLKPRLASDLGVTAVEYPGEDIPKSETFEAVTWNIEWFGSSSNGPDNDDQQMNNVIAVIDSIDADLFAFQEIANTSKFYELADRLEEYGGVLANFSQSQKTAYLFKRATIDSLDSGTISTGMTSNAWAGGRFPLMFRFNAKVSGYTQQIFAYNIHAKAFGDTQSRERREDASEQLKAYLDNFREADNVLFLGDYNDLTTGSITEGQQSPYKNFVDDPEYTVISSSLEDKGFASQSSGSMIDHITISSELYDEYFEGTERVENTNYIGSYLSTTSDHYPVWTRFQFRANVSAEAEGSELPVTAVLHPNYPNPFNPETQISFELPQAGFAEITVYDITGRKVSTLFSGNKSAGIHTLRFDASGLSSGVYMYRLKTGNGTVHSRKMLLMK